MRRWSVGNWKLLRTRTESLRIKNRRGQRKRKISPISAVPAQVEKLESRQLLTVTFHGGAVLANVEAQAVYLGSDWKNSATLQSQSAATDKFLSTVVQSPYMDMLTNAGYNVGRGSSTAGAVDNVTLNKTTGVTDAQIQGEIQSLINSGQLQAPDGNRLYVVNVEPGVVVPVPVDVVGLEGD